MTMQHVLPSGVTLQRRDAPADPADLPPHVLERIALRWAQRAECPPGRVVLREEELGWVLSAAGVPARYATFVDKVTGRIVSFANPAYLDDQYRAQLAHEHSGSPRPQVETPGVIAEVTVGGSATGQAGSVRTDEPPTLHPLVQSWLTAIPARARVRGAAWHPELVALGEALRAAGPVTDLTGVEVRVEFRRVREPADPRQGETSSTPCPTCADVLGHRPLWPDQRPARKPASRWQRHLARRRLHTRSPQWEAAARVDQVAGVPGVHHRHVAFPAAVEALERYLGARSEVQVPGRSVRTAPFHIDPLWAADTTDTLARVAARVGAPLFPLGTAGYEGVLAIDPGRRVFLIDETGEWSLGTGLPEALDTLLLGRSAPRVRG